MAVKSNLFSRIKNDRQKINLPNLLTLSRMMILTPLVLFFLIEARPVMAGIFFILASLTDLLDGYLARKWDQVSVTGKILDPVSDKVLVLSPLLILGIDYDLPWVIVITIFLREFIVSFGRELLENRENLRASVSVSYLGKIKTWVQCVAISYTIFQLPFSLWLMWIAVFFTVVSGFDYFVKYRLAVKK